MIAALLWPLVPSPWLDHTSQLVPGDPLFLKIPVCNWFTCPENCISKHTRYSPATGAVILSLEALKALPLLKTTVSQSIRYEVVLATFKWCWHIFNQRKI